MEAQLQRWIQRLSDLPQLILPTDYPRPIGESLVQAIEQRSLDLKISVDLVRLALFQEQGQLDQDDDSEDEDEHDHTTDPITPNTNQQPPSAFHLLLTAFIVLLHRYTGDTDLIIATSSPSSPAPLLLRIKLDPTDSFWQLVKKVQSVEQEAEDDKIDYDVLLSALSSGVSAGTLGNEESSSIGKTPLFRVRFIDQTDQTQASFLESTSSTSDLTVFVTSSSLLPSSSGSNTGTPTSLRTSLVPTISLTLSYNSLVFSQPRISYTLDQLTHLIHHASLHPLDPIGSISLLTLKQRKLLPDPKKDLEWTGYRGAITDIFSANAAKFPDRTCIVESVTSETVGGKNEIRQFTYQQIDEASNVLAHHLVAGGVQRSEVVTVYSTRGVDLVVAVMGVLKAGCTFSVIGTF